MSDRIESIFMSMSEQNKKALVKNHVGWASE